MSKSKPVSIPSSVEAQIRTRARNLPIHQCYINKDWEELQYANLIITRKHTNGNITFGDFIVDLKLLGIVACSYWFNESPLRLNELLKQQGDPFEECNYTLAHNIIYAGLAFAEDYGFPPDKNFKTAQYILEVDTDKIPDIEIPLGNNGIPVLQIPYGESGTREIAILDKTAGDDYQVVYLDKDGNPTREECSYNELLDEVIETGLDEFLEKYCDSDSFRKNQVSVDVLYLLHVYNDEEKTFIDHDSNLIAKDARLLKKNAQIVNNYEKELSQAINYFLKEKTDQAIVEFHKVIERHPDDPILWDILLYNLSVDSNKVDGKTVKEAYSRFPDHPSIKAWYAECLAQEERADEIFALFNHISGLDALTKENIPINIHALTAFCYSYAMAWLLKKDVLHAEPYYQVIVRLEFESRMSLDIQEKMIEMKIKKLKEMFDAGVFGEDDEETT